MFHNAERRPRLAGDFDPLGAQERLPHRRPQQRLLTLLELHRGNPAGGFQLLGDSRFLNIQLAQLRVQILDLDTKFRPLLLDRAVQGSTPTWPTRTARTARFDRPGCWSQMDSRRLQTELFRRLLVPGRLRAGDACLMALARHTLRETGSLQPVVDVIRAQMTGLGNPVSTVHRAVLRRATQRWLLLVRTPEPLPSRPLEAVVDPLADHQVRMPVVRRQLLVIRRLLRLGGCSLAIRNPGAPPVDRQHIRRPVLRDRLGVVVRQQERVLVAQLVRQREQHLREQPRVRTLILVSRREQHARIPASPARQVASPRADHLASVADVLA